MKNKNFIIVVIGQIISLLGNAIQRFCMSLYILDLTGSAAVFSSVLAISTIPYIIFAPIAGLLADTINRKKIMLYLDFISAILMGIYSIVIMSGRDNIIILGSVMFILSTIYTLYTPSVTACIPQIVDKEKLTPANGVIQQVGATVNLIGPILAGILYSFVGIKTIVILNAISFLIAAILEIFLEIPDIKFKQKSKNSIFDSIKQMKRSFIYLKEKKKVVLGIIISYGLTNIFVVPILSIVSPYFIKVKLNMPSSIYGFVEGVFVLGMIIGGILVTFNSKVFTIKKVHKTMYPMIISIIIMGIATYLTIKNKFVILGLYSIGGFGIMLSLALSNVVSLTYIQKEIKEDMLGRVSAFSTAVATVSVVPGQLIYGQLIEANLSLHNIMILTFIFSLGVIGFIKWNIMRIKIDLHQTS
ncbi:MFS-type transporter involved in bile tolerance, Atg22 family [Alkalithermobacter thermoalcaliphilus JW-YL-7 = DSM 7308]|uniref:MFS-type transporter involved in bile tolerance, Atg22 family n=1 Tax=Alkalithermobacter thermoalcaliphilus JW-YL-7 = DSM 7308 TaxID=1121328 RepID=A0A150FNU5_CLOPD|nr:major facilitator superfamily MFS_1 [[Clostridium] paradoxum JW-YL-7 = DSM 7308]SHK86578.1 MFS-type transporter involved in bile tolerance, Atg22 family [[Clostridium] paradoxum JW-YL-7 = DSM 7308]